MRWHVRVIHYNKISFIGSFDRWQGKEGIPFESLKGFLHNSHFVIFLILIHCSKLQVSTIENKERIPIFMYIFN